MPKTKLSDQLSVTISDKRSDSDKIYAESMARNLLRSRPTVAKPVKPEGMTKEEWYASMQAPSTKAILNREVSQDETHFNRQLDVKAAQVQKSGDEVLDTVKQNLAKYDYKQISHVESVRRRSKNTLGQSPKSATPQDRRNNAVHHFEVSGNAKLTEQQKALVTKIEPTTVVVATQPQEVWVPMTLFQAIVHWLKGNKVEHKPDDTSSRWGTWSQE